MQTEGRFQVLTQLPLASGTSQEAMILIKAVCKSQLHNVYIKIIHECTLSQRSEIVQQSIDK